MTEHQVSRKRFRVTIEVASIAPWQQELKRWLKSILRRSGVRVIEIQEHRVRRKK